MVLVSVQPQLEHEEHEVTPESTKISMNHDWFIFVISGVFRALRVPVLAQLQSPTDWPRAL